MGLLTGQGRFDVSQLTVFKYPLRHDRAKSIVVEFAADGNGNSSGQVDVFLGEAISGAPPWFAVKAGTVRVYPSPETDFVSIVPSRGAQGICTVTLSQENLGVGVYSFSGGGSGGAVASAFATQFQLNGNGGLTQHPLDWATTPNLGDALVAIATCTTAIAVVGVAGYTLLGTAVNNGLRISVFVRIATGTAADNAVVTYSGAGGDAFSFAFDFANASEPIEFSGGPQVAYNPTTPAIPVTAGSIVVGVFLSGTGVAFNSPIGWSGTQYTNSTAIGIESTVAGTAASIAASASTGNITGTCAVFSVPPA